MKFIKTFEAKNKFQNKQFQIKLDNLEKIKKEINEIAYILEDDNIYISQESGLTNVKIFEHFINIDFEASSLSLVGSRLDSYSQKFGDYFYLVEDSYNEFFDRCQEICKKYNFTIEKYEEFMNRKDPSILRITPN